MQSINFYQGRVAINVLAKNIENARAVYDAAEGHAVIGVLSAQFDNVAQGIEEVKRWQLQVPSISVGLGAGDPAQFYKAAMIAAATGAAHVNQTFTGCGFAAGALAQAGQSHTHINALVSPTGKMGQVQISTGERSAKGDKAIVSCDSAVNMMLDMGAHAAKFFPMGGERSLEELKTLAESAARNGMTLIEPTGGIDLDNFGVILQTCLQAGVQRVMPHVYTSIIDPQSGETRPEHIKQLMDMIKAIV
ncbi:2-dehydro-3-deoxy-phosphogluconate aldolase [Hafnia alvei]|uniref:2-dehydro-3-deoxy-phosphogluconate aldolase n=1 Tax=Hafnia alvei TaxID=569 RepID=UPI0011EECDDE|nr:KDGP aldolase [Hafnia alvei]KAA0264684.1 oxo-acid lyase [Hafnia alvei]